jgi:hypothetical protein
MAFILKSISRGDDLFSFPPKNIAVSEFRGVLERLRLEREAERNAYLAQNHVHYEQECVVIIREEIEEVPSIK